MLIKKPSDILPSEITSESAYINRRKLVQGLAAAGLVGIASRPTHADLLSRLFGEDVTMKVLNPMKFVKNTQFDTDEELTTEEVATSYNNFYEFSLDKEEPKYLAQEFQTEPWTIQVTGDVKKKGKFDLQDWLTRFQQEERIYRMRCVEGWSMVIPWIGFPLAELIKHLEPDSSARYVAFETLEDRNQFPGQRRGAFGFSSLDWPYLEGLRMDEALNPLTLMATGMYGKQMPPQNGAPIRLVVPWKYGFKGIKSIVRIHFTSRQPKNSWQVSIPREYGFYANVNPEVPHPRWSQAVERRLTTGTLTGIKRIPTMMFNGYAEQVADLYKGMDLSRYY
jgi:sulfoxide reductase catalytic subunit YedY